MDRFKKAYGKAHMAADDLPPRGTVKLIIANASWSVFPDFKTNADTDKIVLEFTDAEYKPLIVSKPVARTLAEALGTDIRKWIGKAISLYVAKIEVKGERISVIRCDIDGVEDAPEGDE